VHSHEHGADGNGAEWLIAGLVWPAITGHLLCLGSAALVLVLLRRSIRHTDFAHSANPPSLAGAIMHPLIPWWSVFAIVNLLFFALLIVAKTAGMADVAWPQALPLISEVMTGTHAGAVWLRQLPASIALLAAALIPLPAMLRAAAILVLSAALLLMDSLTGHAIDGGSAIVFDFVHQLAAGLWAGALLSCWLVARRHAHASAIAAHAARILSRLAAWSVFFLISQWNLYGLVHDRLRPPRVIVFHVQPRSGDQAQCICPGSYDWRLESLPLDAAIARTVRSPPITAKRRRRIDHDPRRDRPCRPARQYIPGADADARCGCRPL
jgi:hypothetical protein